MKKLDGILNDTSSTPPGNGKTSSNPEFESAPEAPLQVVCQDPDKPELPCPICGGRGAILLEVALDDPRFGRLQRCPNNPVDQDAQMHARLRRYGNLQAYQRKTFDNFHTVVRGGSYTQSVETSLEAAKTAGIAFATNPQGFIVYEGKHGCGKTHLAAAIANLRLEQFGERVIFVTTPDLLDLLRSTMGRDADISLYEVFDQIRNARLLVLDDLGVEKRSEWACEKLFQLLNHRQVEALPTVITTNTQVEELDPSIGSRLLQGGLVKRLTIAAPDYRRARQARAENDELFDMQLYKDMRFDTFDDRSPVRAEAISLENAKKTAQEWAENPRGWLFLMGDYGTGKTHLAAAIAQDLYERGRDVKFITVPDLLDYLRRTFDPRAQVNFDERFHEFFNIPILILDDLRLASATPWAREKLFQIIDHRYLAKSATVITSSETMEEIDPRFATRLADRRICRPFALSVPSYVKRSTRTS